jgi:hypothetical protein
MSANIGLILTERVTADMKKTPDPLPPNNKGRKLTLCGYPPRLVERRTGQKYELRITKYERRKK